MSVVPAGEPAAAASIATKREGFWNRLALALDRHFPIGRSARYRQLWCAVPNTTSIGAAG